MLRTVKYLLIIFLLLIILFPFIRSFLIVNEEPKKSDVIIVLSGDFGRLKKAAKLYHAGYADRIMLSLATEAGTTTEEAIKFGVPKSQLILEREATSTFTNALYTKKKMGEYNLNSAIVVSSDYHMRRVKLVFDRVYSDSSIDLTYVASFRDEESKDRNVHNVSFTVREYAKLIGYWLKLYKFIDL